MFLDFIDEVNSAKDEHGRNVSPKLEECKNITEDITKQLEDLKLIIHNW